MREAIVQTEAELAELNTSEELAKVEGAGLGTDSTQPTDGPQNGPAIGPELPSSLQAVQVPTDEDSVAGKHSAPTNTVKPPDALSARPTGQLRSQLLTMSS